MKKSMIQPLQKILITFLCALSILLPAQAMQNQLKDNPSPYLAMHGDDPVHWQLWGKDVLEQARREGKLLYVSIGYFSCHWCHVMQRESYSDAAVGAFLNKYFIPVKVDRELRPELDRRMIRFVEAIRGQAGWPLNVFITPDGYPVTGFTYLPRDNFYKVLQQLEKQWLKRHDEISRTAKKYFEQTEHDESKSSLISVGDESSARLPQFFISQALSIADLMQGGFGETTKFPSYPQLNTLMHLVADGVKAPHDVPEFIKLTLDNMASRHLMDPINNGFYRYSTDPDWHRPHFEKMLYDNAQLASLYLDADKIWPKRGYADIALRTLDFMRQFLRDKKGGYNASLSAVDVNNVEGGGYLWSKQELKQALTDKEYAHLKKIWRLDEIKDETFQANPLIGIGSNPADKEINHRILQKLRSVKKSTMPVDSKRLASWNSLVLMALVKAQRVDSSAARKRQMNELYRYMRDHFIKRDKEGVLQVVRFAGQQQSAETTLEDTAYLAAAMHAYAQQSGDPEAKKLAQDLVEQGFARYYRNKHWFQNNASLIPGDNGDLIIQDAVLQSPGSLLLQSALSMPELDAGLQQKAQAIAHRLTQDMLDTPYYYGSTILLQHRLRKQTASQDGLAPDHDNSRR